MDVSGVGQSPAGYSAVPETALDPQRSGPAGAPEKSGQVRQAPLDLLSDARLGRELMALGLRPDAAKLLAARALMLQQGRLDLAMLLDVERSLHALASPGPAEAEAAAFLVARRLPATTETVSWVTGRQHATEPAGMRMLGIIQRFAAAMAARSGLPAAPLEVATPGVPSQAAADTPATAEPAAHPTPGAPAKAPSNAGAQPASTPAPAPAPQAPVPAPAASVPAAEASADAAGAPDGEATPARPLATPGAPGPAMPPAKAPAPHPVPTQALQPAPTPSHPATLPAATLSALVTAVASELPEAAATAAEPGDPAAPATAKPQPAERELLARLQALTLPEGKARDVEAALRRLVQALRPQEADLAQGAVAEAKERLSATATKAIAKAPHDANVRAVHDELRFQQVNSARHEGQTPHEIVIPVWWKGGSGEIRVQERPEGAARRSEEASAPVRVVMALETPHLGALRIDLLLAQRQVNCLVAVQDQGAADFLSPRLTELRSAIEETGVHVHGLGMKPFTPVDGRPGPGDAKGVDYYG